MPSPRTLIFGALTLGGAYGQSNEAPIQLHGSGTTNPSKFFWDTMDLFEERAKVPLYMTYRAVGSGTGQTEFVGANNGYEPYGDFGSGDIPMSASKYTELVTTNGKAMVHIPFAIGPVGIFHGVPVSATGGHPIKLTICLLAKIFARIVKTWDHADILALNPHLNVPANTNINVARRKDGSSSTSGTTQLFEKRCASDWTLGSGSSLNTWPADTNAVEGSGNMVHYVQTTEYSIGYMEASHGYDYNLPEVALQNLDGVSLTSKDADIGAAATTAVSSNVIPASSDSDWSSVNLLDLAGPNTWPITLFSYFYVRKDLSGMDPKCAGLLKAFIMYTWSTEGKTHLESHGFVSVPTLVQQKNTDALNNLIQWPVGMVDFTTFETAETTQAGVGFGKYALSSKRRSYSEVTREIFEQQISALQASVSSLEGRSEVVELHGSGTTNPSKSFWEMMDLLEERAKVPLYMTYRAIGSGGGQAEFVGASNPNAPNTPHNHFGSGDIPMSSSNFAKLTTPMVHIPFAVGPVGIFHSVPSAVSGGVPVRLTVCLLAKIFARTITTWDDPAILAMNPKLSVPAGTAIHVGRRGDGSSSTSGVSQLFEKRCAADWTLGSGSSLSTWPADTTAVEGSGGMVAFVKGNSYAIGYMEAGHGHDAKLREIALTNANGKSLTTKEADLGAAAVQANLPADPSADWSGVNLYDLPGDSTWPITLFSYFYVKKDVSSLNPKTAALLKAFVEFTLSDEGQAVLQRHHFAPLPAAARTSSLAALNAVTWPATMVSFRFETATATQVGTGAEKDVLSGKRRSYTELAVADLQSRMDTVQANWASYSPVSELHGSGTTNPSKFFWQVMDLFSERSRRPLHMTYRAVGSGTGQKEFVGATNPKAPYTPFNDFGSGDIPMSAANYAELGSSMVHIPFAIGPVGIFHGVPASATGGSEIKLSVCLLAKIFARVVKTWDHAEIMALNPNLKVPAGTNIEVARRADGSSSTTGVSELFKKRCPEWTLGSGSSLSTWPADTNPAEGSGGMTTFVRTTPYSIGYMEAGHGHAVHLPEIAVENAAGKALTTKQADVSATAAVALSATPSVIPADPTADWSGVNLYDLPGDSSWPITLFSYFYVQKDLSGMHPETAALLKAFIEFTMSTEGKMLLESHQFKPLPQSLIDYNLNTLEGVITWPEAMPKYGFETSTTAGAGADNYMLSVKRRSFGEYERSLYEIRISDLEAQVEEMRAAGRRSPPLAATTTSDDHDHENEPLILAAIVLSCVAILFSAVAMCVGLRRKNTMCWDSQPMKDGQSPNVMGSPQA